ncbi:MAG: radical SAM protein [Thermodesulfovibrionales bacterium]|nr:radical SAM protein [Thermodesulfovibrionales bacterium]
MKVLFITKPYVIDPLGIAYLSSTLKKAGHSTELVRTVDDWRAKLREFGPQVAAFSMTTGQHREYIKIAGEIKEAHPGIKVVFGGPHPTYFHEVSEEKSVDFIIRGEGETAFLKLIEDIESSPEKQKDKIRPIDPLVQDLDSIAPPDRDLIYRFPENRDNPIKNVMTSRGCPFFCPYCYNSIYKELYKGQKIVRYHSIDRVIEECREIKNNYPVKFIFFADDEFALQERRLEEFSARYKSEIGLPYHAQLRIDLLTDKKAKLLKDSGCASVTFAIEAGSEEYRKKMLHRNISDAQIFEGCRILNKYGIAYRTENMIGLPFETLEGALKTLDLNIKCKPAIAWASLYQPYPRTELGDLCKEKGLFGGDVNKLQETFFEDSVLPLERKKEFVNLQRLFGLVVSFPALRPFLKYLLKVPVNRLYSRLYVWWKHNRYDTKLYKTS